MNRGYIKFWRKAEDSVSWGRGLMYQGLIINLLSRAVWKKGSYKGHDILPGQFGTVINQLAVSLEVPRSTLQRMLAHLVEDGFLKVKNVGNRFSIISIVNWHCYQGSENPVRAADGPPVVNQRAADGPPSYNVEEDKKVRSKELNTYSAKLENSPSEPEAQAASDDAEYTKEKLSENFVVKKPKAEKLHKPEQPKTAEVSDGQCFLTRKKRKLTGKRLAAFERFWEAFADKRGKAEAADAWLDIPSLTDAIVLDIINGAKGYAKRRHDLLAIGQTPKMAQGWISGRRWEDEPLGNMREPPQAEISAFDQMMLQNGYDPRTGKEIVTQ